jgi:hypothetical protein
MPLNLNDIIPSSYSGIRSVKCECGFENVYVLPEEFDKFLSRLIFHLVVVHHIDLPDIQITSH